MSKQLTPYSSGTMSTTGFRVEARVKALHPSRPVLLQDGILGTEWRLVMFSEEQNPAGVPMHYEHNARYFHLLGHASATALAWTLIAQHSTAGMECRLVHFKLETQHKLERDGESYDGEIIKGEWP